MMLVTNEAQRMVPQREARAHLLMITAAGQGRSLDYGRALEIAQLIDEEDDAEVPNVSNGPSTEAVKEALSWWRSSRSMRNLAPRNWAP
jgi:hypothetical protein